MAKSSKIFEFVEVAQNRKLPGSQLHLLTFFSPKIALTAKPGQFIELGFTGTVLPKPFSIHRVFDYGVVEILYQVVGPGTQKLSKLSDGDQISVLGPLGKGFVLPKKGPVYLVGGGTGIAPMLFLQDKLKGLLPATFLGARTKDLLPNKERFDKDLTKCSTDDGSNGFFGTVIDLMSQSLLAPGAVLACGPKPMLKALWGFVKNWNTQVQFSLESYMACGVGACLGCVIETNEGSKKVCTDGPVFEAKAVADAL